MKNLILVLFAIVTFSFGINAQNLSFKTFNQTVEPKGELAGKFEAKNGQTTLYVFNEWDEFSITQWQLVFDKENNEVFSLRKFKFFYDEIDLKINDVRPDESSDFKNIYQIRLQGKANVALITEYKNSFIEESAISMVYFYAQNEAQTQSFIAKLKEKAFDMSLELDSKVERVTLGEKTIYYNKDYPTGISGAELDAIRKAENEAEKNAEPQTETNDDSKDQKSVSFVTVTLKHTGGERYYLSIIGVENADCNNQVFSFTHSKYGEETRRYTFCEGQKLIEKNTGRVIFTATKAMDGTTYKIN